MTNHNIALVFEQQARTFPHQIALVDNEKQFSYSELDQLSNQFAQYLKEYGLKQGSIVGICISRSAEMIISMLSILKAGGIYVLMSPCFPKQRIAYIIEDANIELIITTSKVTEELEISRKHIIIDEIWPKIINEKNTDICFKTSNEDIACAFYTSGTTGAQKGVLIQHKSIIQLVKNSNYVEITNNDIFLQLSPPEFDGSTFEIWGALLNAAKLVLMPPGHPTLFNISEKIENYNVTILFITTQLFNAMVDYRPDTLIKVEKILFGGEVASISHVKQFLSNTNINNKLTNVYGPTECTSFATSYLIQSLEENKSIPIGKPISHVEVYILNNELECVPIGIPGELYIGGSGVAKGYISDEKLTSEKFVNNPFTTKDNQKLFKTGDIVEMLPDGNIRFIGREDNLIKIRGFRVSSEEIELIIKQYPLIKEAVIRLEMINKRKVLIAYLVPTGDDFILNKLKQYLQQQLPLHMIPNHFLIIEKIPLNHNGKIDYQRLNTILNENKKIKKDKYFLSNDIEMEIYSTWKEVFEVEEIDIFADFFDMGGDSLLAITILEKFHKYSTHEKLKQLSLLEFFQNSSINALSAYVLEIL